MMYSSYVPPRSKKILGRKNSVGKSTRERERISNQKTQRIYAEPISKIQLFYRERENADNGRTKRTGERRERENEENGRTGERENGENGRTKRTKRTGEPGITAEPSHYIPLLSLLYKHDNDIH